MTAKYFVMRGDKSDGPHSLDDLKHFQRAGALRLDDLCAREGDNEWKPVRSILPKASERKRTPGLLIAGVVLCVLAALGAFYFVMLFDVSVSTNAGRVANLDLLNQRQNGVILCAALGLAGVGCLIANAVRK